MQKILAIFVCAAVTIGGIVFLYTKKVDTDIATTTSKAAPQLAAVVTAADLEKMKKHETPVPVLEKKASREAPEGYKEYRNEYLWFQMFYPTGMIVKVFEEKDGARTITFRNSATGYEFQIFATPYFEDHISPERFSMDLPSGRVENQIDVLVDGVRATAFNSTNQKLGDTFEVWIISRGFLYEISTYKELSDWMGSILGSWQFL